MLRSIIDLIKEKPINAVIAVLLLIVVVQATALIDIFTDKQHEQRADFQRLEVKMDEAMRALSGKIDDVGRGVDSVRQCQRDATLIDSILIRDKRELLKLIDDHEKRIQRLEDDR